MKSRLFIETVEPVVSIGNEEKVREVTIFFRTHTENKVLVALSFDRITIADEAKPDEEPIRETKASFNRAKFDKRVRQTMLADLTGCAASVALYLLASFLVETYVEEKYLVFFCGAVFIMVQQMVLRILHMGVKE